jgi:hypothetical protein
MQKLHPMANADPYRELYSITEKELVLMKAAFLAKPRRTKAKMRVGPKLKISMAHMTSLAPRSVYRVIKYPVAELLAQYRWPNEAGSPCDISGEHHSDLFSDARTNDELEYYHVTMMTTEGSSW